MSDTELSTIILIATHGRPDLLRRTLESLAESEESGFFEQVEVEVVENGGRQGAGEVCEAVSERLPVRYRFVPEAGKSNALNVAVGEARADLLCFYDDDVRVGPGTTSEFIRGARKYGAGHFFGGPLGIDFEERPPEWLERYLPPSHVGWSLGDEEIFHDEPDFIGTNWAVFRDDLERAGRFDDRLGPNAEYRMLGQEREAQMRLLANGCRGVYLPEAGARHYVPKERCTLAWARDRRYRAGMSEVLMGRFNEDYPRIGGIPRFMWRQCAQDAIKAFGARLLLPEGPRLARYEMKWAMSLGTARGYRMRFKS